MKFKKAKTTPREEKNIIFLKAPTKMYNLTQQNQKTALSPRKKKRKYSSDNNNIHNTLAFSFTNFAEKQIRPNSVLSSAVRSSSSSIKQISNKPANIVDRVLDLSKYNTETGLYTLTRDWINASASVNNNKCETSNNSVETNISDPMNMESDNATGFITCLPDPEPLGDQDTLEIDLLNEQIKKEIRVNQNADLEILDALNLDDFSTSHALLKLHVDRWKQCRRKWISYYEQTNRPYKSSLDTLKSIFEEMQ